MDIGKILFCAKIILTFILITSIVKLLGPIVGAWKYSRYDSNTWSSIDLEVKEKILKYLEENKNRFPKAYQNIMKVSADSNRLNSRNS